MNRARQVAAAVLFLLAAGVGAEALRLRSYTSLGPGPGFFPLWLAVILGVLSLLMFVEARRRPQAEPMPFLATRDAYMRMAIVVAAITASVILLQPLGFRLTMLGMLLVVLFGLGRDHAIVKLATAGLGSFGVHYAFVQWLHIPLPRGPFGL